MDTRRNLLKKKQRVVIKIGSSSLQHTETGDMDYIRLEVLVRELCNLKNQGKDVVLVSSGAIAQGKKAVHLTPEQLQEHPIAVKQACAAVGQARLMMTYQKIFAEYNQVTAQILMTRQTISNDTNRINAQNTFEELFRMGVIPIVNENDTVATHEIEIGDNDTLSAIVASMIGGTGGMSTKLTAATIATASGADMVIANSKDVRIIHRIIDGENYGTLFLAEKQDAFDLPDFVENLHSCRERG